jgi:hypothetical protein
VEHTKVIVLNGVDYMIRPPPGRREFASSVGELGLLLALSPGMVVVEKPDVM